MVLYGYDAYNRQTSYTDEEGNTTSYTYTPDGLRSSKTQNGATTNFYWDRGYISTESKNGTVTAKNYVGINGIFAREANNITDYMLKNGHSDVVSLVRNGAVTRTYDYDVYGVQKNIDPTDTNPFRYCGEYFDKESGSVYLRCRYYSPEIGRFTTMDKHWNVNNMIYGDRVYQDGEIKFPDMNAIMQSSNLYAYCMNNPVGYIDPDAELAYPGEIHNFVVNYVAYKYGFYKEETIYYPVGWGRADLISEDGRVWDVKRDKPKQIAAGVSQVDKYIKNKWKRDMDMKLETGGYIESDSFFVTINVDTYYVSYRYAGGGVIAYDYYKVDTDWEQVMEYAKDVAGVVAIAGSLFIALTTGVLVPVV